MVKESVQREMFEKEYAEVFGGDAQWNSIQVPQGDQYVWSDKSLTSSRLPVLMKWSTRPPVRI